MSTRSKKYAPSPRRRFRENTPAFITSHKLHSKKMLSFYNQAEIQQVSEYVVVTTRGLKAFV